MDVPLTVVLFACGCITYTVGSSTLQLTSYPSTASPGQPYTLMCSSSGSSGRSREWYWRNDIIFRTRYVSDTQCALDIVNNDKYTEYLSGRVNVSCSNNLYNVTLRVNTSIDNGSVWWCVDSEGSQGRLESNRWTIHVSTTTTSTTTAAASTATSTTISATAITSPSDMTGSSSPHEGGNEVVYIAAGVGGGVAVTIVVVVTVLCIRRQRRRSVSKTRTCDHKNGQSHTYYNEDHDLQGQDIDDKIVVENDIYETSNDVTSPKQPSTNDHVITDLYAQVQKHKKSKPGPTVKPNDTSVEDLYAKPDKTKKRKD
ncbi:uncharacterized protein LOC124265762 isoform X2 [Haliotis rubra]|uniref:uncharacterized protein LOC124265762 isoform X2 n=1 Tax=Haliotis rubra TaxID=36100 RepID=UPI001EE57BBF|nr:uncharacterized protein LOC124265762 isoform X2 [Haliotis rubra]